jgi:hypothetical protein
MMMKMNLTNELRPLMNNKEVIHHVTHVVLSFVGRISKTIHFRILPYSRWKESWFHGRCGSLPSYQRNAWRLKSSAGAQTFTHLSTQCSTDSSNQVVVFRVLISIKAIRLGIEYWCLKMLDVDPHRCIGTFLWYPIIAHSRCELYEINGD